MNTAIIGAAGEHYIAYVFSAHGYAVGLSRGGSPFVDLMVCSPSGEGVAIQVKTSTAARRSDHWEFDVGSKAKTHAGDRLFYAFVDLNNEADMPDVFIVPSSEVQHRLENSSGSRLRFWITDADQEHWHWRTDLVTKLLHPLPPVPGQDETEAPRTF